MERSGEVEWGEVKWCGVEWRGVAWSGLEWSGAEWSGVEWNGVEWNRVGWSGVKWRSGVGWNAAGQARAAISNQLQLRARLDTAFLANNNISRGRPGFGRRRRNFPAGQLRG